MANPGDDSTARLMRHSNPRLPAQEFVVGNRVHIASDSQPQTYEITKAYINKDERVWMYSLKGEDKDEVKLAEEGELQR
ncbi:uncharacterized protein BKCO1_6100043 [Diplodia corticola]|uniref:Uncharacterized protein n=1 Tax=Diplodia corticola TaxID=236234 RepID=A0A1J9RCY6_9PEZI|nr:uncharacterized protein BKCO1_6100043 [Diplodia corticola]OJD30379.1 hypothetical protein BKCO1_6100043 [Diplodia corticola]